MKYRVAITCKTEGRCSALKPALPALFRTCLSRSLASCAGLFLLPLALSTADASLRRAAAQTRTEDQLLIEPTTRGIRELIPEKYRKRYQEWKGEFLSTATGRSQWEEYSNNTHFLLTITVSQDNEHGATTGNYVWSDSGRLVAATITLGCRIDEGYPNPIDYPVLNSLKLSAAKYAKNGRNILAAAKIAHEFGHVSNTARTNVVVFQIQNKLIPAYNRILISNSANPRSPKLIELSKEMGGTSLEIWRHREYQGEANAMLYLRDKITKKILPCQLFTRIRENVESLAVSDARLFLQITESRSTLAVCVSVERQPVVAKR